MLFGLGGLFYNGPSSSLYGPPSFGIWEVFECACFVGGIYLIARYALMKYFHKAAEQESSQFRQDNAFLRQRVLELVQNDAVSDEEKQAAISEWLSGHSAALSGSKESVSSISEKQKKLTAMTNIAAIALLVIVLVLKFVSMLPQ